MYDPGRSGVVCNVSQLCLSPSLLQQDMGNTSVLSSNSHYNELQKPSGAKSEEDHFNRGADDLTRHPSLCFDDGNLAIVTEQSYFLIHRGLLCRQSARQHA